MKLTRFDIGVDLSKRNFLKAGGMAGVGALTLTTTACPFDGKKVSFYAQTISSFLVEIGEIVPAQAAFIAKIVKVVADLDAAAQRGDFASASTFFNTMVSNVTQLITNIGGGLSPQVKILLAVASAAIRSLAVLLKNQGATTVSAVASARASNASIDSAVRTIERLASPKEIDATFEAVRL